MSFRNSFGADRYYPPAGSASTAEQPASLVPARPQVGRSQAVIVGGLLRCTFVPAPGRAWLVRRITVSNTMTGKAFVYEGDYQPQNVVSGTRTGTFDENDTANPIFIPEGSAMLVVWLSATTGVAWSRIEYVEV